MKVLGLPARLTQTAVAILVGLDLLAVAALGLHRTTTTTTTIRPLTETAPQIASNPPVATAKAGTPVTPPPAVTVPVSSSGGDAATTPKTKPHRHAPHHTTSTPPKTSPGSGGTPPVNVAEIGRCPIKLDKPAQMGGVQSFVPFAPAFGPFSAEAFAAAAAYQPELELLGPILAEYPKFAPQVQPLLNPVLTLFGTGANSLFSLISPLYTPKRTQVLAAETKLAAFFAPYSKKLVGQPLAGCVVDLEAALVGDTKSGEARSG